MRDRWFFIITGVFFGALILSAFFSGEPVFAIPIAIVALLVLGYWGSNRLLRRHEMGKHDGDPEAALSDASDPVPTSHVITDDETGMGDTSEAHQEMSPRDFPVDHPGRDAAETQAAEEGGTTEGNEDPGRQDRDDRLTKDQTTGKDEGYETSQPTASQARSN